MGAKKASKAAAKEAEQARAAEAARQQAVRVGTGQINEVFGSFNDDFYAKNRQNYIDYATPQLEDQYADANKQLTYSLARSGQLDSSVRAEKASDLQKLFDTNKTKVADDALGFETQSRNSVEEARSDLVRTLNSTGDAQGAVNSALARSTALSRPQNFSPLSQLFSDFTAGVGAQAAAERSHAAGGPKPAIETGLFAIPSGSVQTRR